MATTTTNPGKTETLIDDLKKAVPAERVLSDPAELFVYEADGFTIAKARPAAVVFVQSTDETVKVVRTLARRGVQIVPRGTGTGLAGGCVAFENRLTSVSLSRVSRSDATSTSTVARSLFHFSSTGGSGLPLAYWRSKSITSHSP